MVACCCLYPDTTTLPAAVAANAADVGRFSVGRPSVHTSNYTHSIEANEKRKKRKKEVELVRAMAICRLLLLPAATTEAHTERSIIYREPKYIVSVFF